MAGAVFVVAETNAGQRGPVAALLSTAGWAEAAERVLGAAWLVGRDGPLEPAVAQAAGSSLSLTSESVARGWRRWVPVTAKTAGKDLRQWRRARQFVVDPDGPWRGQSVTFVWQRHDLFHTTGLRLAEALGVPSVVFVPATIVWQAERWGVRRPGWGRWLERRGEGGPLRDADVVACGSPEVAAQVLRLGVAPERVVITPTGVDVAAFDTPAELDVRRGLALDERLVVGWVGSFRAFHALDALVDAVAGLEGVQVLFVGDGPERPRLEERCRQLGIDAVFTGTVAHRDVPRHLGAMDVGVILAEDASRFHYSPLKLPEYLAAGLPVVAPRVPQLAERLTDEGDALLWAPDRPDELRAAIVRLRDDPALRQRLSVAARRTARAAWSWDDVVRQVVTASQGGSGTSR